VETYNYFNGISTNSLLLQFGHGGEAVETYN
jgi:hypothetical protein